MKYVKSIKHLDTESTVSVEFVAPDECPICHKSIEPIFISGQEESNKEFAISYLCKGCRHVFLSRYKLGPEIQRGSKIQNISEYLESLPVEFLKKAFPDEIQDLSPRFSKIYNQALQAEALKLDEICGMGYRKALEFLVKDYCHRLCPDDIEEINKYSLKKCIDNYFDNRKIRHLAEVSAFIGNEEAHYQKEYDWGTIDDMKRFINALVHFISSELQADEATKRLTEKFNHPQN